MQMRTTSLSWANKPPDVSTQLGPGEARGAKHQVIGPFENSLERVNVNEVRLSTIHNI
jgi:hypothetical protein